MLLEGIDNLTQIHVACDRCCLTLVYSSVRDINIKLPVGWDVIQSDFLLCPSCSKEKDSKIIFGKGAVEREVIEVMRE